ncbi:telomere repeats-binding bouquet formation protein 1-like [Protopterus annectens]|uniref:telomere repeats-binding bouquet formation protein 1-like n=1 Tax=Protopterus annectens TaxID=7888 RepID=UPI001CF94D05|nr:telomere repeats-binding bouquet formation protein 1-like [Protopterus annectens]
MIQILAESQDEDLSKAATFVLQNCRNLTKQMSDLFEQSNGSNTKSPSNKGTAIKTITDCWEKAENIIQRIERLERQHNEERINCQPSVNDDKVQGPVKIIVSEDRSIEEISKTSTEPTNLKVKFQQQNGILESVTVSKKLMETEQKKQESEVATSDSLNPCIPNKVDTILKSVTAEIIKLSEEMQTENEQKRCCALESSNIFKCPVSVTKKKQLKENMDTDTLALCSDITDEEVGSLLSIPASAKVFRCSGCVAVSLEMNSRNFSKILHSCPYQCDRHKVMLKAEDRYKSEIKESITGNKEGSVSYKS